MGKRVRSRVWVDRQIQGALAIRIVVHWCLFAGIAAVLTLILQYVSRPFVSMEEQIRHVWSNQGVFAVVMAILLPIFIYDTIKLSNRFAGPVLRLRRTMREIAEGKPAEKLIFRGNDFWQGMAADFNKLIDSGFFDQPGPAKPEADLHETS